MDEDDGGEGDEDDDMPSAPTRGGGGAAGGQRTALGGRGAAAGNGRGSPGPGARAGGGGGGVNGGGGGGMQWGKQGPAAKSAAAGGGGEWAQEWVTLGAAPVTDLSSLPRALVTGGPASMGTRPAPSPPAPALYQSYQEPLTAKLSARAGAGVGVGPAASHQLLSRSGGSGSGGALTRGRDGALAMALDSPLQLGGGSMQQVWTAVEPGVDVQQAAKMDAFHALPVSHQQLVVA